MTRFLERHPLCLTALSPIHIGTGEDLDWTSAVLDGDRLVPFDPLAVTLPADALAALARAAEQRSAVHAILDLQKVFRANKDAFVRAAHGAAPFLPPEIAQDISRKIGHNVQRNDPRNAVASQLRIDRMTATATAGRPLIPGSSLKGALRTAEIARLDGQGKGEPVRPRGDENGKAVDDLVGAFHNSTFSKLALSDLEATDGQPSLVVVARNVRRKPKERVQGNKGIPVPVEAALPFVAGGFRGDVRILKQRGGGDTTKSPDILELLRTTHRFHRELFAFFRREIERDPARTYLKSWLDAVAGLAAGVEDGRAALVRLGKFGSAESKTVAARRVRIPQAKEGDPFVLHPYTLWLADPGRPSPALPFGWALLEAADEPGAAVRDFCANLAGTWPLGRTTSRTAAPARKEPAQQTPAVVAANRIIADRSSEHRDRLATLEDQHDKGREYDGILKNYIKQSRHWPVEDRQLLARLVRDKLRSKSRLKPHEWRELDPLLPKLPD
jgi:CRISPR-associated protein Csm5